VTAPDPASPTARIRQLNDSFRTTFLGGRMLLTPAVQELSEQTQAALLEAVRSFSNFTTDNDPHHEHDFGSIELHGETWFFKIDYYAPDMEHGSEDPADPEQTTRVLTIMRADEY
jgi:Protein of unknown function (DUF3768)